jgi:hypothetical protein
MGAVYKAAGYPVSYIPHRIAAETSRSEWRFPVDQRINGQEDVGFVGRAPVVGYPDSLPEPYVEVNF